MQFSQDLLRECAQVLAKNGLVGPYYVSLVKHGVPFWVWIDENGEFVPPPQTIEQPTVA